MQRKGRMSARCLVLTFAVAGCGMGDIVAPAEEFAWGRSAGGQGDDYARAIATGPNDTLYVTGNIEGTATFGVGEIEETTLVSAGLRDMFVAKYLQNGQLAWVRHCGGVADDSGRGLAVADDGSVLVAGAFTDVATFGAGEANETTLSSAGGEDIFVARFADDGSLLWAHGAGGIDHDRAQDLALAADGAAFVVGEYQSTALFGEGGAGETSLPFYRARDIFVARYEADGTLAWVRRAGGDGENIGRAIATSADGGLLITGEFRESAIFGEGQPNQTTLVSRSAADVFVAKYGADGALAWARRMGSASETDASDDVGWDIAGASDGGVYVTGEFGENAIFGEGDSAQTTLVATALSNLFVCKLDGDGVLSWVARSKGSFSDAGIGVAETDDGGAVVTGRFHGSTKFDNEAGVPVELESRGLFDIMTARYSADGALVWAKHAGGYSGDDTGNGVAVGPDGGILVVGAFAETAEFRDEIDGTTYLQSQGMRDVFVAKLAP